MLATGVLLLAGCGNKNAPVQEQKQAPEGAPSLKVSDNASPQNSVITSIKDAMGIGKTMRCAYKIKNQNEEMEMVSYVKGENYMTESTIAGNAQKTIFNSDGMYSWSASEKKGTKMTKACMEDLTKNTPKVEDSRPDASEKPDPTGEKSFDGATDVKCEETTDVNFSVPTDINFVDQCEMMKKMMNNLPTNMPKGMPANVPANIPTNIPQLP